MFFFFLARISKVPAWSHNSFVLAPHFWNEVLTNFGIAESLAIFCKRLKTHLLRLHLDAVQDFFADCSI